MVAIKLESPNYVLRTIGHADASESWARWLEDPRASRMLNMPPRAMPMTQVKAYIDQFDGHARHLFGMFVKPEERLVGITQLEIDHAKREFVISVLTGDPNERGKGARTETRIVLYQYLFEELGMLRAHATTLAINEDNIRSMERRGWRHVASSYRQSAHDQSQVEIRNYILDRETWRRIGG